MNEREAVRWCAARLDESSLMGLLRTTKRTKHRNLVKLVTAKFYGDLQTLLAELPKTSLVHLVNAWAAETPAVAKVSGLPRATVDELKAALKVFLIDEWRIPVEQPSAKPVAGGRLTVVKGAYAPIPKRRSRATWFTERWRMWVGEGQVASQLLTHEYPEIFNFGELFLHEAEREYYAVRDLETRIAELKDAPAGLGELDQQRAAAAERARAACEAMRADLNAGSLSPRVGPMIDWLVGGLDPITDTDVESLHQRLRPARQAMTRQARLLGEVGPGIEQVLTLWGRQAERDFFELLSAGCGDAVVPLIRLIRHEHTGRTLANMDDELTSARTHAQRFLAEVRRGAPFCYSNEAITIDSIQQHVRSNDIKRLAKVVGERNTLLSDGKAWTRPTTVVAAAARVLQLLGLKVPIDPLYRAINANPQVRSETDSPGGQTIPPTPSKDAP